MNDAALRCVAGEEGIGGSEREKREGLNVSKFFCFQVRKGISFTG